VRAVTRVRMRGGSHTPRRARSREWGAKRQPGGVIRAATPDKKIPGLRTAAVTIGMGRDWAGGMERYQPL
jgi:hypothetical protein